MQTRTVMAHVGAEVRRLRQARKLTLQELADSVDMDVSQLSKLERGVTGVDLDKLVQIASALSVPYRSLFPAKPAHSAA